MLSGRAQIRAAEELRAAAKCNGSQTNTLNSVTEQQQQKHKVEK